MRAPKVYVLSILVIIFTLPAAGYAQTGKAQTAPEANDSQEASPKPTNSGESTPPNALPNSRNNLGQATPGNKIGGLSRAQRATPAIPAATDQNSNLLTAPIPLQAGVPQNVLFEFLFSNISDFNRFADSDDKAGKHSSAARWRTHDQRAAGLNDAEGQILQETALDCLRALKEQDAKIHTFLEKDRAQATPGVMGPPPPELIQLVEERKKIVSNHVDRLREALGDASFNKLDTYVHSSFHAEVIVPKPATPSITAPEKSR